jgi:hypothetical protein
MGAACQIIVAYQIFLTTPIFDDIIETDRPRPASEVRLPSNDTKFLMGWSSMQRILDGQILSGAARDIQRP